MIEKLAKLADTDNDTLRAKLAQAMGNCCEWPGNRALFGQSGAVAPLVNYLGLIFQISKNLFSGAKVKLVTLNSLTWRSYLETGFTAMPIRECTLTK